MSHIGKKPIQIPLDINISYNKLSIKITGPLGSLSLELPNKIECEFKTSPSPQLYVQVKENNNSKQNKKDISLWGTYRSLINNMVIGVSRGFSKKLELVGVGYRASLEKNNSLNLKLGYSHPVEYSIPNDVKIQCLKPTLILITGIDHQRVNQVASEIRRFRSPEPYKGKGIRYGEEEISLKEGKKK